MQNSKDFKTQFPFAFPDVGGKKVNRNPNKL